MLYLIVSTLKENASVIVQSEMYIAIFSIFNVYPIWTRVILHYDTKVEIQQTFPLLSPLS